MRAVMQAEPGSPAMEVFGDFSPQQIRAKIKENLYVLLNQA